MKWQIFIITVFLVMLTIPQILSFQASSENYNTSLMVISSGGTNTSSENYQSVLAIGQIAYTNVSSENYHTQFGIFPYRFLKERIEDAAPIPTPSGEIGSQQGDGIIVNYTSQQQEKTEEQSRQIQEQVLTALCSKNVSFTTKLTSKCKIPDNGICDDGENFLINNDCKLTLEGIRTGKLFKNMWFLRFVFLFSIFILAIDSKKYPFIVILLILLFVYNGAFINTGTIYDPVKCMDVNFLINFGYCTVPDKPVLGWLIGFAIVALFINYFIGGKKEKEKKKQEKEKPKIGNTILIFILVLIFMYVWAMTQEGGIGFDKTKCTDVGFLLNFGECIMPSKPIAGWLIGVVLIALLLVYLFRDEIKPKPKTENYIYK